MRRPLTTSVILLGVVALVAVAVWLTLLINGLGGDAAAEMARVAEPVTVEFAVTVPDSTPADQTIYLSGSSPNLGNWDAAGVPLRPDQNGVHRAGVELLRDVEYGFKVTRGTWGTVERGPEGEDIPNHRFRAQPDQTVEVDVATWVDGGKAVPGRITVTGDVRMHPKFVSDILGNERTLIVYLPEGYDDEPDRRYGVLYVQDGQNLFNESTSFAGVEWQLDEAAQSLIERREIEPLIIVGIYNTEQRDNEYAPAELVGEANGDAANYARFLVEEVMPFINDRYRTRTERAQTGVGGAALGGLVSLYTLQQYPQTFGRWFALSPWLRIGDQSMLDVWSERLSWADDVRLYVDMGLDAGSLYPGGSEQAVEDFVELERRLEAGRSDPAMLQTRRIAEGTHNEPAWSRRIESVLAWLWSGSAEAPEGG